MSGRACRGGKTLLVYDRKSLFRGTLLGGESLGSLKRQNCEWVESGGGMWGTRIKDFGQCVVR